jgi:hypothetical protein
LLHLDGRQGLRGTHLRQPHYFHIRGLVRNLLLFRLFVLFYMWKVDFAALLLIFQMRHFHDLLEDFFLFILLINFRTVWLLVIRTFQKTLHDCLVYHVLVDALLIGLHDLSRIFIL